MKLMKKLIAVAISSLMMLTFAVSVYAEDIQIDDGGVVILYTNDIHNACQKEEGVLGFSSLAAYKKSLEEQGKTVILVDGGDAIQGGLIGAVSEGEFVVDIMEYVGYDVCIPGNHEFDFGMEQFLSIAENSSLDYISCNFKDLRTDELVLPPYKMITADGIDIAFVGITTPYTTTSSTPAYFKDENGEFIYGFSGDNEGKDLYDAVQTAVDDAKGEGADYVIAVAHTGYGEGLDNWDATAIINNTSGIDFYLDAHAHLTVNEKVFVNKDGETVLLTSTGTKLQNIAEVVVTEEGITSKLINSIDEEDADTKAFVDSIYEELDKEFGKVVANSEVDLVIYDPETGDRLIRTQETNLGNLCADAYREVTGADIAFVNGGGIRENIKKGDVTYMNIINVHPFGNMLCMMEVTGQQVLDALEHGMRYAGKEETGSFLQVSGITFKVDTSIESPVVTDEGGTFIKIDGERRVYDVKVNGELIEADKKYTVASHNYMLKLGGDGYTMFNGGKLVLDEIMSDYQVIIKYITETLNGAIKAGSGYDDPYGEGRIAFTEGKEEDENVPGDSTEIPEDIEDNTDENIPGDSESKNPPTGAGLSFTAVIITAGYTMLSAASLKLKRK
ncbi:MAG: bifunctional metallophosphatase/5'-nucleotidase [Ruminococcaceae bacterium]|nr:bifunctional metallophosphatase/5'-nucleotidase [Oscillospiraceae bacterium]